MNTTKPEPKPELFLPAKLVAEGAKVPDGWVLDPSRDGWKPLDILEGKARMAIDPTTTSKWYGSHGK